MPLVDAKRNSRKALKRKLASIPQDIFLRKSALISKNIIKFIEDNESLFSKTNMVLGVFAPLKNEAKWNNGLNYLNKFMAFPGIVPGSENEMAFFKSGFSDLIETNEFGVSIMVPPKGSTQVLPNILLVPGLGFSKDGKRLGRGKGFYDKYLSNFKGPKIGICVVEQLCSEIPAEEHDQLMNFIITDLEIINTGVVSS